MRKWHFDISRNYSVQRDCHRPTATNANPFALILSAMAIFSSDGSRNENIKSVYVSNVLQILAKPSSVLTSIRENR